MIRFGVECAKGRTAILAGTGSNSTASALENSKRAEEAGADALLLVTPYYNKPTEEGLYEHFRLIARSVTLPVLLYNVPSRTGCQLSAKLILRLIRETENIQGIKEASGDITQVAKLSASLQKKGDIYAGGDEYIQPMMSLGAKGVISVISNLYPEAVVELADSCLQGDFRRGMQLQLALMPVLEAMFAKTNPIGIKKALQLSGLPGGEPRLPLCEMGKKETKRLKKALCEFSRENVKE